MTSGWSWFITIVTLVNIVAAMWLLFANGKATTEGGADTGHVWDGDIRDGNTPLPRWWFWLFVLTTVWGVGYLLFYPGLGNYSGVFRWSQEEQHAEEVTAALAKQAPRYARFATLSLPALAADADAMGEARSLFANGCAGCHGSDARGATGFPNLTDADWLYGSDPAAVELTIGAGRIGVMPAWGAALGPDGVAETVAYVQRLAGIATDAGKADAGAARYAMFCVACHGADGRGNVALGGANLTDDVWLHGGDAESLRVSIADGRQNEMPAHEGLLGRDRVRLLAAYVLSLGGGAGDGRKSGGG